MPPRYSIHLFGTPSVSSETGHDGGGQSTGKPLALLSYLIVEGKTPREKIIGLLWGEVAESKARNAFRQALHRLRTALGDAAVPHDPDQLFVADELKSASDVSRFERFLAAGDLENAINEYGGDFLAGLEVGESAFEEWRDGVRKRYKAQYRDALRTVIRADIDAGEIASALRRASALAASDPGDADAAILLASTLLGAGRRAEAQQVLEEFERLYRQDFGSAAPTPVREFLARLRGSRGDSRGTGSVRAQTRFVGREKELSLLLARMRSLAAGAGSLVMIDGDEGVGKTRLIDEFLLRARDLGTALLLQGRERSPEAAIPYASVAEALRGLLDAPGIAGTGQHLLAEAARLLPQLRDQFSLPPISDISDDASRLRFYEGIAALLDSVAYEQPVCIALDDFHNASATTYGLVEYLAERLNSAPILFLICGRPTPSFVVRRDRLLLTLSRLSTENDRAPAHVRLGGLDAAAARELVRDLTEDIAPEISPENIAEGAEGVPFRIVEACARIRSGDEPTNIPLRLRDALWGRLQRGTQAEQRLFVTVALFDRPVAIRLLAAASHLPEKSALDAALSLERAGLLRQRPEGVCPAHDFSVEVALDGTGPAGRALLAGWAAEALEKDGSGTTAELARLFALAGRRNEAFRYSRSAALEGMGGGAIEEATHHLNTARATAPTRQDRDEIESLLRSLSGGARLLKGETIPHPEDSGTDSVGDFATSSEAEAQRVGPAPADDVRAANVRFHYLRPALATAAAVALLLFLGVRFAPMLRAARIPGTSLADSLIVVRELNPRDTVIAFATGPLGSPLQVLEGATRHGLARSWIDSLRLPWTNPLPSPDRRNVAIERISKNGSDLYVISMDRRDTVQLHSGDGDDLSNGWSPDGRWLLGTHGATGKDGSYKALLFAYSVFHGGPRIAFDTLRSSSIVEAAWSPDGSHVAWTTRVGAQHQEEIFVSDADGGNVVDVSNSPAEDYSIAWSPDGRLIAFTSERSGRAELYSVEIATGVVRRLTWEGAHADHAAFSPDGRWLAYESTRGGSPAVYVMPSGGGTGRSVASSLERVSLIGWRGRPVPYIDQVFLDAQPIASPGDTGTLSLRAVDRQGNPMRVTGIRLNVLDPSLIRLIPDSPRSPESAAAVALARGLARVTATAGSWRADTSFIPIGLSALALINDRFEGALNRSVWRSLGAPAPIAAVHVGSGGSGGAIARSDREWESGLLSSAVFPVRRGLSAEVWVSAPFTAQATARSLVVAFVAADPAEVIDSQAPHFLRLAAVSWLGEAGRLSYSVGRETFTEPLGKLGTGDAHRLRISIGDDDAVSFFVDNALRWKSSLRVLTTGPNSRAQLWLGTQATGTSVVFDDVVVRLQSADPKKQ